MNRFRTLTGLFGALFLSFAPFIPVKQMTEGVITPGGFFITYSESQSLTRAAPTASPLITTTNNGVYLRGGQGYRIWVCAGSGQTLSGAGKVDIYTWSVGHNSPGVWGRNKGLDETVNISSTDCSGAACQCQVFPDHQIPGPGAYILPALDGVTVSSGSTATLYLEAWGSP